MNKMIENIKQIHTHDICMFKIGNFYHVYGRDAYIIAYLFQYKLRSVDKEIYECGFPVQSIPKITAKLQNNKISYVLIDRRNNYEVDEKEDFKNLNRYMRYYNKARNFVNIKKRIEFISEYLAKNVETEGVNKKIRQIEEILNENN